jgi:prevent-host-death family protein
MALPPFAVLREPVATAPGPHYARPMAEIDVREAGAVLAELVDRARAGEDIVIARDGKRLVRLVPVAAITSLAEIHGALRGRVHLADDFDDLPNDIAQAFDAR